MAKRKTPEDYHDLALSNGGKFIGSGMPKSTHCKTIWRCGKCGCEWSANYNNISQGHWCPDCAKKVRGEKSTVNKHVLIDRLRAGEKIANAQCLSFHHKRARTPKKWRCNTCGNEWESTIYNIERGRICRRCAMQKASDSKRFGPAKYLEIGKDNGFEWLGPKVRCTNIKTNWRCENGHVFSSPYSSIRSGDGCAFCAGTAPKESDDYHELARLMGFSFIGDLPPNTAQKGLWRCGKGHKWEATYGNIRAGWGCPWCVNIVNGVRASQVQIDLRDLLGGELNVNCGTYYIDVTVEVDDIPIAVEYDGWYWHGGKEDCDIQRTEYLISNGWRVLRIKSNNLLPTLDQLDDAITELVNGRSYTEIVLDDWGVGNTFHELT